MLNRIFDFERCHSVKTFFFLDVLCDCEMLSKSDRKMIKSIVSRSVSSQQNMSEVSTQKPELIMLSIWELRTIQLALDYFKPRKNRQKGLSQIFLNTSFLPIFTNQIYLLHFKILFYPFLGAQATYFLLIALGRYIQIHYVCIDFKSNFFQPLHEIERCFQLLHSVPKSFTLKTDQIVQWTRKL